MQKSSNSQKSLTSKDSLPKTEDYIQSPRKPFISLSLPKINEMDNQSQSQILSRELYLPNIHKVRWSLAPTCLNQNHESKSVLYICMNPQCKQSTRLACQICFYQNHAIHNTQFIAVDQVKVGEIGKLRYWPFDKKFKTVHEFINKNQNYIQMLLSMQSICQYSQEMIRNIMDEVGKLRLQFLNKVDKFYVEHPTKRLYMQQIKIQMEQCFQIKKIRKAVNRLFSKEIKHNIFATQIDKILNDQRTIKKKQKLYEYFITADRGKDMTFDKKQFLKKQNQIVRNILQQRQTIQQQGVKIQFSDLPIQQLIPQSLQLIDKLAKQYYPLTFTKQKLEDGVYTGFIHNKQKVIFGMKSYKNGNKYFGQWKSNYRSGWGLLINEKTGLKYKGQWRQDKKNGYGKEQNLNSYYQGEFFADKRQGFGVLLQNGRRLQITWKNDKKHGKGKIIQSNGMQTQVYYLNGVQAPSNNKNSGLFDIKQISKKYSSKQSTKKKESQKS